MDAVLHPRIEGIGVLLRGELDSLHAWLEHWNARRLAVCLTVIFVGAGCYGAAMGFWRDPLQAVYVAVKFPLIILLTTFGNALINAMLAPLLGLNIGLRQSFLAILISFTIASAILGAFSPLIAFQIAESGEVINAHVKRSSGIRDIDDSALNSIQSTKYSARPGCPLIESEADVIIDFR